MTWTVAFTRPSLERIAARNLDRKGIESYLPIYWSECRRRQLLFPRYIFIVINDNWNNIFRTWGIAHLMLCGEIPHELKDSFVAGLRKREDEDGVIRLPKGPRWRRGQKLRVMRGTFEYMIASYVERSAKGADVAWVDMMGRHVMVEFQPGQLEAQD